MKLTFVFLVAATASASAQDSSFAELRLRGSLFRNPVVGQVSDDWRAKTGAQLELATNVGRGELGLAVGHLAYTPTTGKPAFTGTLFTLAWLMPVARVSRVELDAGVRLTDLRMDFDDPSLVWGLRTEEEVMLGVIGRARFPVGRRFSVFVDGSYGLLMLNTKTPMVLIHGGMERTMRTPDWLRDILR